ncbi:MAG: Eco57I restriction-modification methylase domain-containing protein, partial [Chloroflexota bacterium]
VQWLLQNSLGRSYHELYPDSRLPDSWPYYIRPETREIPAVSSLAELTLIDPCMGSGHFLREAFDMFVAMYREREPVLDAAAIADRVLAHHLHGIDIDPRAAQLAAFTLYARAWELVRDERKARHLPRARAYAPSAMNLATSPGRIAGGALQRHLQRHPEDRRLHMLLAGIFAALESADTLGSLLRPREHLAAAVAALRASQQTLLGFDAEAQALNQAIETVLATNPDELENMLLDRVAAGFAAEARGAGDVGALLFGQAAERGVRLLQLLDHRYAVVATNPPYMGSSNMDDATSKYVEKHYLSGKRDLYAAFILRNLELCLPFGRVSMVTQQSWMFLSSFADLRAVPEERLPEARKHAAFTGLLRETRLETLAHLGANAFPEISGEVVQSAMFVTANARPAEAHRLTALRLVGLRSAEEKAAAMRQAASGRAEG